ncbi:elongation factor P [Aurantibacillus circumpalustris]|uniref:elongation factor P n=1 Tax=Aurantibacillus circumpalustris TaxID=3036359 RepID=UPI00295B5505|nr:elongation factor P [Aurantibacillus circumpalustris]
MADTGDINVGSIIRFNGELVQITDYQHRTPGNLRAFYQAKMRNLKNGKQTENRFRSGEGVEIVRVEFRMMQFIYTEGEFAVVMDNTTFEQVHIPMLMFGDSGRFLKEGMEVKISFEGDDAILAEAPTFVEVQITYAEPGLKGDTATNTLKPATIDTGTEIRVPLFVNEGDWVKVDTRTGEYVERVKK